MMARDMLAPLGVLANDMVKGERVGLAGNPIGQNVVALSVRTIDRRLEAAHAEYVV